MTKKISKIARDIVRNIMEKNALKSNLFLIKYFTVFLETGNRRLSSYG